MCSASFCHWAGSRVMLLIFTLRRRLILGDSSLFSLLSLTPAAEAPSRSGLCEREGPSGDKDGGKTIWRKCMESFLWFTLFYCFSDSPHDFWRRATKTPIYMPGKCMLVVLEQFVFVYFSVLCMCVSGSQSYRQQLFFTMCLSCFTPARLLLSGQFFLSVLRLTPESHLPSHPAEGQTQMMFTKRQRNLSEVSAIQTYLVTLQGHSGHSGFVFRQASDRQ